MTTVCACRLLRASLRASGLPEGGQRTTWGVPADVAPCDDGWLAMSWRADGMQGADGCCAVRWQADGGESAGGTQSARRMLRGKQVDGAQGVRNADASKSPPVMPTACAHKGMRTSVCVSRCCAGSERMVRGGAASGAQGTGRRGTRRGGEWCAYSQQKVRRDYIWLARAIAHFRKRAIHQVKRVCGP